MNEMADDILRIITNFLSLKELLNVRMASKDFKRYISERDLNIYRLNNKIQNFLQREDKLEDEINPIIRNIYQRQSVSVHSLFTRNRKDRCIVEGCYLPRLDYIFTKHKVLSLFTGPSKKSSRLVTQPMWVCSKRKMPYCIQCFEKWINPNNIIV